MSDSLSFPVGSSTRDESSTNRPALRYTNPLLSSFERKEALVFSDNSNRFSEWPSQAAASERVDVSNVNSSKQVNFIPAPLLYSITAGASHGGSAADSKMTAKTSDEPLPNKLPPKPQPHIFADSASAMSSSKSSLVSSSTGSRVPLIHKTLSKRREKGGASSPPTLSSSNPAEEQQPAAASSSAGSSVAAEVKADAMSCLLTRAEALLSNVKKATICIERSPDAVAYDGSRSKPSSTSRIGDAPRHKNADSVDKIASEIDGTSSQAFASSFPPMPATDSSDYSGMLYGKTKPSAHATEIDWLLRGVDEAYDDEQVVSDDMVDRLLQQGGQPPSQLLFPFFYEKNSQVMNLLSQIKYLTIDIKQILIYSTNFGIRKGASYFIVKGPLGTLTNDSVLSSVVLTLNELNEIESFVEENKNAKKRGALNDYFVGLKKLRGKQHCFNIRLTNDIIKCWMQSERAGGGYDGCIKLELYSYLSSPHNQVLKLRNEPLPYASVYIPLSNLLTAPRFDATVTCDLVMNKATNLAVAARMKALPYSRLPAATGAASTTDPSSSGESIGTVSCHLTLRSELESELRLETSPGSGEIISNGLFISSSDYQSLPQNNPEQRRRDMAMTFVPCEKELDASDAGAVVSSGYFGLVIYSLSDLSVKSGGNLSVAYKVNRRQEVIGVTEDGAPYDREIDVFSIKSYKIEDISSFSLPYIEVWQQGATSSDDKALVGLVKLSVEDILFGHLTTLPVLSIKSDSKVGSIKVSVHFFESKDLCDRAILSIMKTFLIRENKSAPHTAENAAAGMQEEEQQQERVAMRQSIDSVLSVDSLSADVSVEQQHQPGVDQQRYNDDLLDVLEAVETLSEAAALQRSYTAGAVHPMRPVLRHVLEIRVDDHTDLFSRGKMLDADLLGYYLYYNMPLFADSKRPFEYEPAREGLAGDSIIEDGDVTSNVYKLWVDKEFGSTNTTNVHEYVISSPSDSQDCLLAILTPFFFGGVNFYVADSDNGNNIFAESFLSFEQIKSAFASPQYSGTFTLPVSFYTEGLDKAWITVNVSYRSSAYSPEQGIAIGDFSGGSSDDNENNDDKYDEDFEDVDEMADSAPAAISSCVVATDAAPSSSSHVSPAPCLRIDVTVDKVTHFNFNSVADSSVYCLVQVGESKNWSSYAPAEVDEDASFSEYVLSGRSTSAKSPLLSLSRDGAGGETVDIPFSFSSSVAYFLDDVSSSSSDGGNRSSEVKDKLLVVFVYSVVAAREECVGYCTVDLSLLAQRDSGPGAGGPKTSPLNKIDGWYHIYSNTSVDIIGQIKLSVELSSDDGSAAQSLPCSSSGFNSLRNSYDDNNNPLLTFALVNEKISSLEKMSQQLLQPQMDPNPNPNLSAADVVADAAVSLSPEIDVLAAVGDVSSSREASLLSMSDEMTAFISTMRTAGSSRDTTQAASSMNSNPFLELTCGDDDIDAIYDQFNTSAVASGADTSHLANLSFVSAPSLERFSLLKRLHVEDKLPVVSIDSVVQKAAASGARGLSEKISTLLRQSSEVDRSADSFPSLNLSIPSSGSSGWNQVTAILGGTGKTACSHVRSSGISGCNALDILLKAPDPELDEDDNVVNADYEYSFEDEVDDLAGGRNPSSLDSYDAAYVPDFDSLSDSSNDYDYNKAPEAEAEVNTFDITTSTASTITIARTGGASYSNESSHGEAAEVGTSILSRSSSRSAESVDALQTFDINDFDDEGNDEDDNGEDDGNAETRPGGDMSMLLSFLQQQQQLAAAGDSAASPTSPYSSSAQTKSSQQRSDTTMSVEVVFSAGDGQTVAEEVGHMLTLPPGFVDMVDALDFDTENTTEIMDDLPLVGIAGAVDKANDEPSDKPLFNLSVAIVNTTANNGEEPESPNTQKIRTIVKEEITRATAAPEVVGSAQIAKSNAVRAGGEESDDVDDNMPAAALAAADVEKIEKPTPVAATPPLFPTNSKLGERISRAIGMKKSHAGSTCSVMSNVDRKKFLDQ